MVRTFETSWGITSHNVIYVAVNVDFDWKLLLFFAVVWMIRTLSKR